MASKKSAKKPKAGARKAARVKNLPAKPLSGDAVRAVKGGSGMSKIGTTYKEPTTSAGGGVTYNWDAPPPRL
jgi:hypothetical protein